MDRRARAWSLGQGVPTGLVQHGQGAARPRDHRQGGRDPRQLPGVEDPLAAPETGRVDRGDAKGVTMNGIRHPFTHALYELDSDGAVRVTLDGRTGRFT